MIIMLHSLDPTVVEAISMSWLLTPHELDSTSLRGEHFEHLHSSSGDLFADYPVLHDKHLRWGLLMDKDSSGQVDCWD